MNITITEKIKKHKTLDNDFDYQRAKVELSRLQKIYSTGCCAVTFDAQRLSNAIREYEKRTMDSIL